MKGCMRRHLKLNLLYLIIFIITLYGCGTNTNIFSQSTDTNNEYGDIVFSLKWETPQTNGTLSSTAGNQQVSLSWSNFSDSGGIDYYKLVYSTSSTPSSCSSGTQIYLGSGTSYTHTGLTNGTIYYYRICATDTVGNTSSGATASATPR